METEATGLEPARTLLLSPVVESSRRLERGPGPSCLEASAQRRLAREVKRRTPAAPDPDS